MKGVRHDFSAFSLAAEAFSLAAEAFSFTAEAFSPDAGAFFSRRWGLDAR
ncbi:hypothetical protein [Streptosporangium sp. V21-05]